MYAVKNASVYRIKQCIAKHQKYDESNANSTRSVARTRNFYVQRVLESDYIARPTITRRIHGSRNPSMPDRRVYTLFTAASQTWLSKVTGLLAEQWPSFKHVDGEMYNVRCHIAEDGL